MINFKDKVIYQIYPKSFQDSNGDGIGDLRGIIDRLDYLEALGVDYLWLTPFFLSPQKDNGYDVADYYQIEPMFGTMKDLEELIEKAEKKQIGIMLDMVFNHTATAHEWFQRALTGEKKYQDYYILKGGSPDTVPTNWISKFGKSAWKYEEAFGKWYLHLFDESQADLNWENPQVREELKKVICFWKEKGIKGFRFDVINLISKPEIWEDDLTGDGRRFYTDGSRVHEYLKELVRDTGIEDLVTVGEMSSTSIENCIRYSNSKEKELSMCFNFHHLKIDYKNGDKWQLMKPDIEALKKLMEKWQMGMLEADGWNAVFWCNHDQPRIVSRLGNDKVYWKESAKMLAASIHMLRGTPYIYQGEELGMTNAGYGSIEKYKDVESLNYYEILQAKGKTKEETLQILGTRSRDNGRTPMQWSKEENAGFSTSMPWIPLPENYKSINAENQINDDNSIFTFFQSLIALRKEKKAISEGDIEFVYGEEPGVFAYKRYIEKEEILVLNNFNEKEVILELETEKYEKLLGNYPDAKPEMEKIVLRPYETHILKKIAHNNK